MERSKTGWNEGPKQARVKRSEKGKNEKSERQEWRGQRWEEAEVTKGRSGEVRARVDWRSEKGKGERSVKG